MKTLYSNILRIMLYYMKLTGYYIKNDKFRLQQVVKELLMWEKKSIK